MRGRAQLADFTGSGALNWERGEDGELLLEGLWQPDDPEQAYDALHRLYMARERITFRGPVHGSDEGDPLEESHEVIILEWSNEEHPAALKLQEAPPEH
ncbi:MAG: hypothetical protein WD273_08495 [Trueperaceae bacterium]